MASDRFVEFREARPSLVEASAFVRDFFGGLGVIEDVPWQKGRPWWMVTLPGAWSDPVRGRPPEQPERWLEVWPHGPVDALSAVNVETRSADPLTAALADGLAAAFARRWPGEVCR